MRNMNKQYAKKGRRKPDIIVMDDRRPWPFFYINIV